MKIQLSKEENIPEIMCLIHQAQAYFKREGIDQWQDGYPNEETILQDIHKNSSYILIDENHVIGTMYFAFETEPTYAQIDGHWLTNQPYAVIHRIVVDERVKGKSLAKQLLDFAITRCKEQEVCSIRIDTHQDNQSMQKFLKKNGFEFCGNITLESGDPRIAFEKILA